MSTASPESRDQTGNEKLYLADWRRCVADLYAEIRRLSVADPEAAHGLWMKTREWLYRSHPSSPVPVEGRTDFRALHFAYDPGLRFELALVAGQAAPVEPPSEPGGVPGAATVGRFGAIALPASTGEAPESDRIGWLDVPLPGGPRQLAVFWLREYSGGIFVPFRDATNGTETYGGGRYLLDTAKGADLGGDAERGTIVIDFNFAYQPSCAFDPRWSCPLAPPENRLDIAITAGEQIG
jgi:uncharacterized protein (DUF1684 family)